MNNNLSPEWMVALDGQKTYPMQIGVNWVGHIIVDNNIDTLNINSSANQVSSHQYPLMTFLESFVPSQSTPNESQKIRPLSLTN